MSMKRFGKAAFKIAQEIATNISRGNHALYARILPRVFHPAYKIDVALRRGGVSGRNPFFRAVRLIVRNARSFRSVSSLAIHYKQFQLDRTNPRKSNRLIFKRHCYTQGVVERIKDVFSTNSRYNRDLIQDTVPNTLDGYEIGKNIGYGCNAAVYALRLCNPMSSVSPNVGLNGILIDPELIRQDSVDSLRRYPLALKLMYNYEFDINARLGEDHLWRSMGNELVALPNSDRLLRGRMGSYRPLPSTHPNVVRLLTAFVDRMPILPDAAKMYPEALPNAPFYEMLIEEPKTLLIVMKRYRMTLRDYVITMKRNYWAGRVMLGQLLEGCIFLYENKIAQRDMKSDNILLEFNYPDEVPHLVISDFGCALATGSWLVEYKDDTIDLGGNLATRAPEVKMARPGLNRVNPFYSQLRSETYVESELPGLPKKLHYAVRYVIKDILKKDPNQRILPHVAANVVCLSLFRFGGDLRSFFSICGIENMNPFIVQNAITKSLKKLCAYAEKSLDDVLSLLAAETIIARGLTPQIISQAELQVY
uniref:non-specific serine/threonine protein kinase n=1 Tax=Heterorhabditis bacteriophora TaxID=37862 RepID=A0A1I7X977_HETBA